MDKKKLIGLVVLSVGIMIVLGLLRISVPLKRIPAFAAVQFFAMLITYPWVWKCRGFTFGRLTLYALVVSGAGAAILLISSALAGR